MNIKFGLDLAILTLAAMVSGSAAIMVLSEFIKRKLKFDTQAPPDSSTEITRQHSSSKEPRKKFKISFEDKSYVVSVEELEEEKLRSATAVPFQEVEETVVPEDRKGQIVKAPLPGVVVSLKCQVGQRVSVGSVLLTLEAMKMENEITAPLAGIVRSVRVREGETVDHGQVLIELSE